MLLEINIKDFAIIDHLHIRLHRLFNVFTGETGAGKSIIIDAVNALLGGKIGAEFVRAGCESASVEGDFSVEALPPVSEECVAVEGPDLIGVANGATTMFEGFENDENRHTQPLHVDAESDDAMVAL